MQLSRQLVGSILARFSERTNDAWETASEYGEPGYSFNHDATTPIIVLGYYWCHCGKNPHEGKQGRDGGSNPYYVTKASDSHSLEDHHPRLWKQLERQGVEFEWSDQWTIDSDHDKAYRTDPDMHGWMPSYVYRANGDIMTADDDIAEWVEWAKNKPARCIPTRIVSRDRIVEAGWQLIHEKLENGHHQGMDDDPQAYYDMETGKTHQDGSKWDYLFMLDETSQFYITFSMFAKVQDDES
jgi:hypothetical protein